MKWDVNRRAKPSSREICHKSQARRYTNELPGTSGRHELCVETRSAWYQQLEVEMLGNQGFPHRSRAKHLKKFLTSLHGKVQLAGLRTETLGGPFTSFNVLASDSMDWKLSC
jgi:hypothetical protein